MAKKTIVLLFNKTSGVFIGGADTDKISSEQLGNNIVTKTISYDPELEYWFGDYESGKVFKFADKPPIHQDSLRIRTTDAILAEYGLFDQINIISEQLEKICGENKTENFSNMMSRISILRQSYRDQKKNYSENTEAYNWIGYEQLEKISEKYDEGF